MRVNRKADIQSFLTIAHWGQIIFDRELKSDNLQYNMLAEWDKRLIEQESDVPSIILSCACES